MLLVLGTRHFFPTLEMSAQTTWPPRNVALWNALFARVHRNRIKVRMAETYDFERPIETRYRDPLDLIWLATARRLGLTVRRSPDVYATSDGKGNLTLSDPSGFDPDDTVAQMILHEVCHWIINGEETFHEPDWGFDLDWEVDWREYACQRLQAALADIGGARKALATTGTYRPYYDRLGTDPLAPLDDSDEERHICEQTRLAVARARHAPWGQPLLDALHATRTLKQTVQPFLSDYASDEDVEALPSWWAADR